MKDELGGKIMAEFVALKTKNKFLMDDGNNDKKSKGIKKCVIKQRSLMIIIIAYYTMKLS